MDNKAHRKTSSVSRQGRPALSDIIESPALSNFGDIFTSDPLEQHVRKDFSTPRDSSSSNDFFLSCSETSEGKTITAQGDEARFKRMRDARWKISPEVSRNLIGFSEHRY